MTTTSVYQAHGTRLSFSGILRSEWIKLTTLRSTVWCYGIIVLLTIGLGLILAATVRTQGPEGPPVTLTHDQQQAIWVQVATLGILFSQLVAAVLGALVMTGEYGTGMIRSTLTAVPTRLPALVAKAVVFAVTTFLVGLVSIIVTALVTVPILAGHGIDANLSDGSTWIAFVGGAGYLALIGLLAMFLGTIIRNSAGGIAAALGLILVAPTVFGILAGVTRSAWAQNISTFLPSSAGGQMYTYPTKTVSTIADVVTLDAGQGWLVLIAWVAVTAVIAGVVLKRRDV